MNAIAERLRREPLAVGFLAVCVSLSFFSALGKPAMSREQELRVALTARDMAETGDWRNPSYLGEPRYRKPPLMYWAVASAYSLGGRTDAAWLARLPSALAGFCLVLLIYAYANASSGRRAALLAAGILASTFIVVRQARLAETDTFLTLFTAISVLCGFLCMSKGLAWRWTLLAGLASGLGFLAKGPAAITLPVLAWLFAYVLAPRPHISLKHAVAHATLWLGCALAVAGAWYLPLAARAEAVAQIRAEWAATFTDETRHPGPWFYYLYAGFHALAPWSLALPFALAFAARRARSNVALARPFSWFLATFVALSATPSKQIHYAILLAPPAALLLGRYLSRSRRSFTLAIAAIAVLSVSQAVVASAILPAVQPRQILADLLRAHREELRAAPTVYLVGPHRASIEFHAGRPIRDIDNVPEALRLAQPGDWIVLTAKENPIPNPPTVAERVAEAERRGFRVALWRVR